MSVRTLRATGWWRPMSVSGVVIFVSHPFPVPEKHTRHRRSCKPRRDGTRSTGGPTTPVCSRLGRGPSRWRPACPASNGRSGCLPRTGRPQTPDGPVGARYANVGVFCQGWASTGLSGRFGALVPFRVRYPWSHAQCLQKRCCGGPCPPLGMHHNRDRGRGCPRGRGQFGGFGRGAGVGRGASLRCGTCSGCGLAP